MSVFLHIYYFHICAHVANKKDIYTIMCMCMGERKISSQCACRAPKNSVII